MPALPYSGLTGQAPAGSIGVPDDYTRVNADLGAFGGGIAKAEQGFGAAGVQAGDTAISIATQIQETHNKIAADDMGNQFGEAARKILSGDASDPTAPAGYLTLQGSDALNARAGTQQKLNDLRDQYLQQMNPQQKLLFDAENRRYLNQMMSQVDSHANQQALVYRAQTAQAAVQNSLQNAALANSQNDEDGWRQGVVSAAQKQEDYDQSRGADPETITANRAKVLSEGALQRAQQYASTDPIRAQSFVDGNRAMFGPDAYNRITAELQPKVKAAQEAGIADAAVNTMAGSAKSIEDAIHGQESGGKANSVTSVDGAQGGWQVIPATFKAYAQPGEQISNPADNERVARRYIADLKQKFSNDPARVAVGYFSGEGNVAPPGSPTPWINDNKDGNGTRVSTYVPQVLGRMGIGNGGSVPATPPSVRPLAIGDSLAAGAASANGFAGSGTVGANSAKVLQTINAMPTLGIQSGTPVVLSSGLSNDLAAAKDKIDVVQQQIDGLHARGVSDIRLLGVGSAPALDGVNDALKDLAAKNPGVTFTGPIAAGQDGIHPATASGYRGLGVTNGLSMAKAQSAPAPTQSQADYFRANYDSLSESARAQAVALHPDDPDFVNRTVARTQQRMNQAIHAQTAGYTADRDTILQAVNGDFTKGTIPTTLDQLTSGGDAVSAAWDRIKSQQPQFAHEMATRVLAAGAKEVGGDAKTYGAGFLDTFRRIHLPVGDPNKITDVSQVYNQVGDPNGLTIAGLTKAREELAGKSTTDGEAESHLRAAFFKQAKDQLSGSDDGLGLKDPKGDQIYLRWMSRAYADIDAAKKAGTPISDIYNPDSAAYVGKSIAGFKRTLAQRTADMLGGGLPAAAADPAAAQPGMFSRMFGSGEKPDASKFDLTSSDGIVKAYKAGALSRADAEAAAAKLGYTPDGAASAPTPSVSRLVPTTDTPTPVRRY